MDAGVVTAGVVTIVTIVVDVAAVADVSDGCRREFSSGEGGDVDEDVAAADVIVAAQMIGPVPS